VAIRFAEPPSILHRIGRAPNPLAFPPLINTGNGRYDDPKGRHSVLYAAEERRTAFLETLDQFRFDVAALAARQAALEHAALPGFDVVDGVIPPSFVSRQIVRFSVAAGQTWLDARSPETHAAARRELAPSLHRLGVGRRFVLGDLLASNRQVTRLIAGWTIDRGFSGIVYPSCHDPSLSCWALFEGAVIVSIEAPQAISHTDPDLIAVARLWNLRLPQDD
jgi:hypothetical protein